MGSNLQLFVVLLLTAKVQTSCELGCENTFEVQFVKAVGAEARSGYGYASHLLSSGLYTKAQAWPAVENRGEASTDVKVY
jgi:hypothetical protein